jgi:rRNA maturation endonuclease Nob1
MCNVIDLQVQLDKVKEEKMSLSTSMNEQRQSVRRQKSIQNMTQPDRKDLRLACDQLEKLIEQRIKNKETDTLLQMLISNSELIANSESRITTEEGFPIQNQRNTLQEKSRIMSKELQKIKSLILKKSELAYK